MHPGLIIFETSGKTLQVNYDTEEDFWNRVHRLMDAGYKVTASMGNMTWLIVARSHMEDEIV